MGSEMCLRVRSYIDFLLPNLPDAFIRDKGIVVVPAEEVGFKERVKNDIVLVEAVPEFKPTVVKRDYEDEGRLREEREREFREEERLRREREIVEREQELRDRERQVEEEERLRRERGVAERERRLQARERELRQQQNRRVRRHQNNRPPRILPRACLDSIYCAGSIERKNNSGGSFDSNLNFGN